MWKWFETAAAFLIFGAGAFGAETATLQGRVIDAAGNPIEHATVMVYHAGVKNGYSTFCPSCYADCGKHAFTDAAGRYSFTRLNSDLWFELLIVRDGYMPVSLQKVDPAKGPPGAAVLSARSSVDDPKRVIRGRVVDEHGSPQRDVVVRTHGIKDDHGAVVGTIPGLDPLAVSNDAGEFEIAYTKPTSEMLLVVEGRTKATQFVVLPTGTQIQTIVLHEGATVRGRLVADSKPVADAEIGLIPELRGGFGADLNMVGNAYEELKIGTQEDGSFAITNVPAPVEWYVYGKMESLVGRGGTEPVMCATRKNGEFVDVGDIQVKPGHRLAGKVVLSDGKPIPQAMRISVSSARAWDFQLTILGSDGHFEFVSLPAGTYLISPYIKGYALPSGANEVSVTVDRDVDGWEIALTPVASTPKK